MLNFLKLKIIFNFVKLRAGFKTFVSLETAPKNDHNEAKKNYEN